MTVTQRALLDTLKENVDSVEERYDGYRIDLLHHLADILNLEREHVARATRIQQKVTDKTQALGALLRQNATADEED
jgi:hypothetical protein|tara:strand:+ start:144 stop:374 length:231 start_codon:yes stop_codon:yes gene_type:complete